MPTDQIPLAEFATRRRKLATTLKGSIGVVFAGEQDPDWDAPFRPHPHFEYLTGVTGEPGAALVLEPSNPAATRREMLFLRPLNPEQEKWDGSRLEISSALRERAGITSIFRTGMLPRLLTDAARRSKTLACLHPPASYDQPVSPDLALFRRIAERIAGIEIIDMTGALAALRAVKSAAEVALIQRAIDITATGFTAVMATLRPGLNEFDVQEALEHAYRTNDARGPAFGTIVGAGFNSTVLHYRDNLQPIAAGDLVCIDSGAAFGGYGADITRTLPASGRFTERQKEVYTVVLRALNAAVKAVKPGTTLAKIDAAARAIITKAGFGDAFLHSIGHHLGLETHDITPDGPLKQGNVITIEPGIYLPEEKLGVRIEDDVLVTKDGCRNLSAKIPKSVAAIEKAMT